MIELKDKYSLKKTFFLKNYSMALETSLENLK